MSQPSETPQIRPEQLQVLAHFYRGEIYRSAVWRTRLDVTTNWAILATTATFSWAFTSGPGSHILFPMANVIIFLLLCIESRRYRYYDVWWTRARMLEGHLIVPSLNPELSLLQGNWRETLSNDLLLPTFKISFSEALARRLTSNYIWLFLLLFFGWAFRVYTGADQNGDGQVHAVDFYLACGYEFIHPNVVLFFQFLFLACLLFFLTVVWKRRHVTGEIRRRDPDSPRWPI